jgi:acyl transferase domain-containing protein
VLLLKRLAEAAAEGDRVLAVLRATATNQDGRMINIATPCDWRRSRCFVS